MNNLTTPEQQARVQAYYRQAEQAYLNWGRDELRQGIYALHCGYEVPGESITHWESIKQLTKEVVMLIDPQPGDIILDAGCGAGAAVFELLARQPQIQVHGTNLAMNQLQSAAKFAENTGLAGAFFSEQDYLQTAFPDGCFTSVIFVESIAHAQSKAAAVQESHRLLKAGGSILVADVFFNREPQNTEEAGWIDDLTRGWLMPDLASVDTFHEQLLARGFRVDASRDISSFILPSTLRMRMNAEQRMSEQQIGSVGVTDEIYRSRRAVVASHKVVASGLIGYYFIKAQKIRGSKTE